MSGTPPPSPPAAAEEEEGGRRQRAAAVKPEPDPLITLKVVDQEGRRAFHTMRMSDRLQGVMDAYYKKVPQVTYGTGTFMFDGSVRLLGEKTAAELDMEDGDSIDFFETQVGGVRYIVM